MEARLALYRALDKIKVPDDPHRGAPAGPEYLQEFIAPQPGEPVQPDPSLTPEHQHSRVSTRASSGAPGSSRQKCPRWNGTARSSPRSGRT